MTNRYYVFWTTRTMTIKYGFSERHTHTLLRDKNGIESQCVKLCFAQIKCVKTKLCVEYVCDCVLSKRLCCRKKMTSKTLMNLDSI